MAHEVGRSSIPLFALIIGIDNYAAYDKLSVAVTDAKAIKQYLKDDLHVHEDHIFTLFDEEATRDAIIKAFRKLRDDHRISQGDPILIFYSGHGGQCAPPPAWRLLTEIQCLIPQDCVRPKENEQVPDQFAPIPDRTIGALIGDIAKAKGDNITVIFDCCHSASGTRGENDELVPRSVDVLLNITETLDNRIWEGTDWSIKNNPTFHGLWSHVLLAACRENELAYENKKMGHGLFTCALLAALQKCHNDGIRPTYSELLNRILLEIADKYKKVYGAFNSRCSSVILILPHPFRQHPQCEGFNQHRLLFDPRVAVGGQVFHPVQSQKGGKYVLGAGRAHGVKCGVRFTLYDERKRELRTFLLDELSSESIQDFETTITTPEPLGDVSFAKLSHVGRVPVYADRTLLMSTLNDLLHANAGELNADTPKYQLVEAEAAKLEITMRDDRVVFKVLDNLAKQVGLTEMPHTAPLCSLTDILDSAARYYWFLNLANEPKRIKDEYVMAVDIYYMEQDIGDFGEDVLREAEPEICHRDLICGDNLDPITVVTNQYYGVKITNKTPRDMYLNVFVFNCSDLSIDPYYTQSTAGEPEVPLKQGGTFTIGHGDGTPPLSFDLENNQDVDVSLLKIFFATRPIDLSDIGQLSPFARINGREGGNEDARGMVWTLASAVTSFLSLREKHTWFTLDVPIVQRRK